MFLLLQVGCAESQREETVSISETLEQTKTEVQEEESESVQTESEESQSGYSEDGIPTSVFSEYWSDRELKNPEEVYPGFRVTLEKNSVYGTYSPVWWHEETDLTIREDRGYFILKTQTAERKLENLFCLRDYGKPLIKGTRLAVDDFTGNGKPELMIRYLEWDSGTLSTPGINIQHIEFFDLETLSSREIDTGYEEALQKEYGLDLNNIKSDWDNGIHMYYRITDDPYERYLHIKLTFSEEEQKFVYDGKPLGAETVK